MEKPDIGGRLDDHFAIELEHDPQHPVGAGVLGAHIEDHRFFGSHDAEFLSWNFLILAEDNPSAGDILPIRG